MRPTDSGGHVSRWVSLGKFKAGCFNPSEEFILRFQWSWIHLLSKSVFGFQKYNPGCSQTKHTFFLARCFGKSNAFPWHACESLKQTLLKLCISAKFCMRNRVLRHQCFFVWMENSKKPDTRKMSIICLKRAEVHSIFLLNRKNLEPACTGPFLFPSFPGRSKSPLLAGYQLKLKLSDKIEQHH